MSTNKFRIGLASILIVILFAFIAMLFAKNKETTALVDLKKHESHMYAIIVGGCSMSSVMSTFTHRLFQEYGIEVKSAPDWEVLKPRKNPFFNQANNNISRAMEILYQDAKTQGKSMIVKFDVNNVHSVVSVMNTIIKPKLVYAVRSNILDSVVCATRDCFIKGFGYPVNGETGEKTSLCLKRRRSKNTTTKAYLYLKGLIAKLKQKQQERDKQRALFEKMFGDEIYHLQQVETEKLWSFEKVGNDREESVIEWSKLLTAWEIVPDHKKIEKVMDEFGTREKTLQTQENTIYNFRKIQKEYGDDPFMEKYLRTSQ